MLQLQICRFPKGSYIVVEGKANSDRFFIIQQGRVQCYKSSGNGTTSVIFGPGDFVGVVPCMSGHLQIETAIAAEEVVAIAVKKEQYPDLIVKNTPVALKIIKTFANRMRVMNEMLTKATLNSVVTESYEQIYKVAKFYDEAYKIDIATYAYYQYLKTRPTGPNAEDAKDFYHISLYKKGNEIRFAINNLELFHFEDDGKSYGSLLKDGYIGFRQMAPLVAEYRNLKVYSV